MSGYADGERGGEVPAGAPLIGKPFSAEALVARVSELLSPEGAVAPAPLDSRQG
jgi:hypothetical protein